MSIEKENIASDLHEFRVPVDALVPMDKNPRRGDVDSVVKSYKAFGQRKPIVARKVVSEDGSILGEVIAGNHQLAAARRLGWSHIAAILVDDDEITAKAFALADNRTSDLGEYDAILLSEVLESLRVSSELLVAAGYNPSDLGESVRDQEAKDSSAEAVKQNDRKTATLDQLAEQYANRDSRKFMAELPLAVFVWVQEAVDNYATENEIASRPEAFLSILRAAAAKNGL